jgi:hypothetical protein
MVGASSPIKISMLSAGHSPAQHGMSFCSLKRKQRPMTVPNDYTGIASGDE